KKSPESSDADDADPADPAKKDADASGALATDAVNSTPTPEDKKNAEAKKNATQALSQLSSVAGKSSDKFSSMAGVASALTEVATRFTPKIKMAAGESARDPG